MGTITLIRSSFLTFSISGRASFRCRIRLLAIVLIMVSQLIVSFQFGNSSRQINNAIRRSNYRELMFMNFHAFSANPLTNTNCGMTTRFKFFTRRRNVRNSVMNANCFLRRASEGVMFSDFYRSMLFDEGIAITNSVLEDRFRCITWSTRTFYCLFGLIVRADN